MISLNVKLEDLSNQSSGACLTIQDVESLEVKLEVGDEPIDDNIEDIDMKYPEDIEEEISENTQCYYCGQMIALFNIKDHMTDTHGSYHGRMHGNPRPIQCEQCKATFKARGPCPVYVLSLIHI